MDYLALISPDPYYFWQTELLIESFRFHGLEDNLVIGIRSETNQVNLLPNTSEHKRKFVFAPQSHKFEPVNKMYGIYAALVAKHVTQPFAAIHPDMILMEPIQDYSENIVFHTTPEDPEIKIERPSNLPWMCIDGTAIFKDVPINFFSKAIRNAQELSNTVSVEKLGKTAWAKTIYQFNELFSLRGLQLEVELTHHNLKFPIVHYRTGMLPYFSKLHYKFFGMIEMGENPFTVLLENNPTTTTDFVRNIVLLYLHNRK